MRGRSRIQEIWYALAKAMVRVFVSVMFRARYSGYANVPRTGGALLVSNHQSHLDPPVVGAGCPRQMSYLARLTLFRFSPFGWLLQSVGGIPIDRDGSALSGVRATLQALQQGEMVLVFPEGTRSADGNLGVFKPGLALVARRAKVPIVPAGIDGSFRAWPRSAAVPQAGVVHVHYGRPLWPDEISSCSEEDLAVLVKQRVCECLEVIHQRPEFAKRIAPA